MKGPGLKKQAEQLQRVSEDRRGFVLPMVVFGLMLMSTMAVVAMLTAGDEQRSSNAMRESSAAYYAAEAGLQQTYAQWDSFQAAVDTLPPGDTLDLGWQTLSGGSSYRPMIMRLDNEGGGQAIYVLMAEGRGPGALSGQRRLSWAITTEPAGDGDGYMLGDCCDAGMTIRGELDLSSRAPSGGWRGEIDLSGVDTHPPGWEDAGVCSDQKYDKPAVVMEDSTQFRDEIPYISSDCDAYPGNVCPVTVEGAPQGIVEDPSVTASAWDQFGDLSWDSLKTMADHVIGTWGDQEKLDGGDIYPRYNGDGTCDTSHPYNWGSDDPDDACFNYFPIILVRGEIEFKTGYSPDPRGYGQGMLILDWDDATSSGTELELGREGQFRGIVLGKGCVEIQKGHQFYGSIYVDHTYDGPSCDAGGAFIDCRGNDSESGGRCDNTTIQWSQCAVDRVIRNSALSDHAEVSNPGGSGGAQFLLSRSYTELFH
jgi:hypothetical protein